MGPIVDSMTAREVAEAIDAELAVLINEAELQAIHHREFIPDGVATSAAARAALDAAVNGGIAIGLERARNVVAAVIEDNV